MTILSIMKTFLEISITANETERELLIPTMIELGCKGFQETDSSLISYIDKDYWTEDHYARLKGEMNRMLQTISSNANIKFKEIAEENWNEQWEKTIQPIEIGKKIVIKPSWSEYHNKDGRVVIQIDPKMSFGTGYHETTRLTLQLLERHIEAGCSMLDVGTGTGILAIAAIKLGAASALGIDLDEWSIDNANENVKGNKVADKVQISDMPIQQLGKNKYDLITANLTLNTNIELLPIFLLLLEDHGTLLLSGLLSLDKTAMITSLSEHQFEVIGQLNEHEWIALAARKNV